MITVAAAVVVMELCLSIFCESIEKQVTEIEEEDFAADTHNTYTLNSGLYDISTAYF